MRKPDGTVVKTPDYNIQDMPGEVTRTAPLYSDIHEKHVAVKGLNVGDVLEYLVRFRVVKPEVPGHIWYEYSFTKRSSIKDERLEISVPRENYVRSESGAVDGLAGQSAGELSGRNPLDRKRTRHCSGQDRTVGGSVREPEDPLGSQSEWWTADRSRLRLCPWGSARVPARRELFSISALSIHGASRTRKRGERTPPAS